MNTSKSHLKSYLHSKGFIALTVSIFVLVTSIVYLQLREKEQRNFDLKLEKTVDNYSTVFSVRLKSHIKELDNLLRFYNSSNYVDYDEFKSFVSPIFNKNSGIQALEWIPKIAHGQLKKHEARYFNESNNYYVWRLGQNNKKQAVDNKKYYYPVLYVYPVKGNESVLGFDLGSNKKECKHWRLLVTAESQLQQKVLS